ncbi:MAG: DUF4177 domain-containing protein [Leucobacter sp.]
MREYSFVSIPMARQRDGMVISDNYHDVIRERAADGWEFVQAISFESHARPRLDLVFTRKDE